MTALLLAVAQLLWGFAFIGALALIGLAFRTACRDARHSAHRPPPRRLFIPEQRS